MAQHKNKRVEFLSTRLRFIEGTPQEAEVNFGEVLTYMNGHRYRDEFKGYELKLLQTEVEDCMIGIIITDQNKNLPPKRNRKTGAHSELGLNINEETLSFGNIFLYDRKLNVFLYEFNVNGCYIDKFVDFIYHEWIKASDGVKFHLFFDPISRKGEYKRLLDMKGFTEVLVEFSRPTEILQDYQDDKSSVLATAKRYLKEGAASNSDTMAIKLSAYGKRTNKQGLDRHGVLKLVDSARYILRGTQRKNVRTLKVKGYFTDPNEPNTIKPVNLVADTFNAFIKLPVMPLLSNLQEKERREGIEKVHKTYLSELKDILNRAY